MIGFKTKFSVNFMFYIVFFFGFMTIAVFVLFWEKLARDHYFKLSSKSLIFHQQKVAPSAYFCSFALHRTLKFLLFFPFKKNKKILLNLALGKIPAALMFLHKKRLFLEEASLMALYHPEKALHLLETLDTLPARIERAALLFELGQKNQASDLLDNLDLKKLPRYFRAKAAYYSAQFSLSDADMENASQKAALSASLFKKSFAFVEEGYAYLLLATIFRVSAVEDVSHLMFRQAVKLFHQFHHPAGEADAFGGLGMLWTMRENFDDALAYFQKSLEINQSCQRHTAEAFVLTQKALALLLQKNYDEALACARMALDIHTKSGNNKGQAFAHQVSAYVYVEQQLWSQALPEALDAARLYQHEGDISAILDSLYLTARIQFELQSFSLAEKTLRSLLKQGENSSGCFHLANAYSLLGLIFLQKNNLARAKALFLKSASLEQKNERFSGAATDYANIGLIETKLGHISQALKTYETALTYASAFEETTLSELIRQKIESLKSDAE